MRKDSGMNKKWVSEGDTPELESTNISSVTKKTSALYKPDFHKYCISPTIKLIDEMTKLDFRTYLNDVKVSKIPTKQLWPMFFAANVFLSKIQ